MLLQFLPYEGYDMRRNLEVAQDARGHYSTDLFTDEAVAIINRHDPTISSLFLYLSHLASHAGNYENPLQAPQDATERFAYIRDLKRRTYAGITDIPMHSTYLFFESTRMWPSGG